VSQSCPGTCLYRKSGSFTHFPRVGVGAFVGAGTGAFVGAFVGGAFVGAFVGGAFVGAFVGATAPHLVLHCTGQ